MIFLCKPVEHSKQCDSAPWGTWQCLEYLGVTRRAATGIWGVEARAAAQHPAGHRVACDKEALAQVPECSAENPVL